MSGIGKPVNRMLAEDQFDIVQGPLLPLNNKQSNAASRRYIRGNEKIHDDHDRNPPLILQSG